MVLSRAAPRRTARERLAALRRELADRIDGLAARVPEEVLPGERAGTDPAAREDSSA